MQLKLDKTFPILFWLEKEPIADSQATERLLPVLLQWQTMKCQVSEHKPNYQGNRDMSPPIQSECHRKVHFFCPLGYHHIVKSDLLDFFKRCQMPKDWQNQGSNKPENCTEKMCMLLSC